MSIIDGIIVSSAMFINEWSYHFISIWMVDGSIVPADMTSNNCSRFIVTNFDEDEDENFEAYSQNNFVFYNLNIEHISILCCLFLTLQMSVFALIDTFYILVYITDQYVIQSLDFSMISNNITVFSSSSLSLLSGGDGWWWGVDDWWESHWLSSERWSLLTASLSLTTLLHTLLHTTCAHHVELSSSWPSVHQHHPDTTLSHNPTISAHQWSYFRMSDLDSTHSS